MRFRPEVLPFLGAAVVAGAVVVALAVALGARWPRAASAGLAVGAVLAAYMLYFFRDPERTAPADEALIVAGADGRIMAVKDIREDKVLKADAVRISIFLSLFDVHVNRAPIAGAVRVLEYHPGKRFFTFQEKSSELNQHSVILIEGAATRCLVHQIVGPVARRVVYWLAVGQEVRKGDRIGMMKFGSRLDIYLPKADVEVTARVGDHVAAGVTVIARLRKGKPQ